MSALKTKPLYHILCKWFEEVYTSVQTSVATIPPLHAHTLCLQMQELGFKHNTALQCVQVSRLLCPTYIVEFPLCIQNYSWQKHWRTTLPLPLCEYQWEKIARGFLFLPDHSEERKFKNNMCGGGEGSVAAKCWRPGVQVHTCINIFHPRSCSNLHDIIYLGCCYGYHHT